MKHATEVLQCHWKNIKGEDNLIRWEKAGRHGRSLSSFPFGLNPVVAGSCSTKGHAMLDHLQRQHWYKEIKKKKKTMHASGQDKH